MGATAPVANPLELSPPTGFADDFPVIEEHLSPFPVALEFTGDFPPRDYWSEEARGVIGGLGEHDELLDRRFVELGSGDGRNGFLALEYGAKDYVGVEYGSKRLELAESNAVRLGVENRAHFSQGDAVEWIQKADPETFRDSVVFACLPQVPHSEDTQSQADGVLAMPSFGNIGDLDLGRATVREAGLELVAASLKALSQKIPEGSNTDAFFVLSNRVPEDVKYRLFELTGWEEVVPHQSAQPVPHDPDTGLKGYQGKLDDGSRFYGTKIVTTSQGDVKIFEAISAEEAEGRRLAALGSTATPGVYPEGYPHHYVTTHHLKLKRR